MGTWLRLAAAAWIAGGVGQAASPVKEALLRYQLHRDSARLEAELSQIAASKGDTRAACGMAKVAEGRKAWREAAEQWEACGKSAGEGFSAVARERAKLLHRASVPGAALPRTLHAALVRNHAEAELAMGEAEAALALAGRAKALDPQNWENEFVAGVALLRQDRNAEAARRFSACLSMGGLGEERANVEALLREARRRQSALDSLDRAAAALAAQDLALAEDLLYKAWSASKALAGAGLTAAQLAAGREDYNRVCEILQTTASGNTPVAAHGRRELARLASEKNVTCREGKRNQ